MIKRQLIDLHIHSNFSDGKLQISEIVDLYGSKGYSAIAITDHLADTRTLTGLFTHSLKLSISKSNMDKYLETIRVQAKRAKEKYNMLLIPGVEVTLNSWSRQHGAHVVFLGVDRFIDPNQSVEKLLQDNSDFFSIAAHPLWEKSYEFKTTYLWDNRETLIPHFDAWECATGQSFSKEIYSSGLPIVASSDFHGPTKFESWKSQLFSEDLDENMLYSAISERRLEPIWI